MWLSSKINRKKWIHSLCYTSYITLNNLANLSAHENKDYQTHTDHVCKHKHPHNNTEPAMSFWATLACKSTITFHHYLLSLTLYLFHPIKVVCIQSRFLHTLLWLKNHAFPSTNMSISITRGCSLAQAETHCRTTLIPAVMRPFSQLSFLWELAHSMQQENRGVPSQTQTTWSESRTVSRTL